MNRIMQSVWIVIAILLGLSGVYCTSDSPPDFAQLPDYVIPFQSEVSMKGLVEV